MLTRLVVALVALVLLPAAAAQADTYCVGKTGCDHDVADLQTALNMAASHNGPDTVDLAGSAASASGFTYSDPDDPVHIAGTDNPIVRASNAGATTLKVVGAPGSTITGIDAIVQPNAGTGIETNGTVQGSVVESGQGAAQNQLGVRLDAGGQLAGSDVQLSLTAPSGTAVVASGADTTVVDSRLAAPIGMSAGGVGTSSTVQRVRMAFSGSGIFVAGGADMVVEDALLDTRSGAGVTHTGASVDSSGVDSSLAMNNVTIAGEAGAGSVALHATASGGSRTGLTFRNGVIDSYPVAIARAATGTGSLADVATDYSDYTGTVQSSGGGGLSETNHLTAAPGFVSAGDFHLRSDSPLVDAGEPGPLATDESPGDASGQPRVVDGSGNCTARRDIGAFEFQPGERAPIAVANAAPLQAATGQPVQFDASQSCDPDGDALTYAWSFDDGGAGDGVTRERGFSRPGLHFAAVTVTDSTGRSTTAVVAVRVTRPELAPFAGVSIPKQTVRVSKSGVAGVKLRCPLGTVGACTGTVTLGRAGDKRMGTASVAIAHGAMRKISVRLTSRARAALKKARRLNATVTVSARDANGTGHRTKGTITLVAPR